MKQSTVKNELKAYYEDKNAYLVEQTIRLLLQTQDKTVKLEALKLLNELKDTDKSIPALEIEIPEIPDSPEVDTESLENRFFQTIHKILSD